MVTWGSPIETTLPSFPGVKVHGTILRAVESGSRTLSSCRLILKLFLYPASVHEISNLLVTGTSFSGSGHMGSLQDPLMVHHFYTRKTALLPIARGCHVVTTCICLSNSMATNLTFESKRWVQFPTFSNQIHMLSCENVGWSWHGSIKFHPLRSWHAGRAKTVSFLEIPT